MKPLLVRFAPKKTGAHDLSGYARPLFNNFYWKGSTPVREKTSSRVYARPLSNNAYWKGSL